MKKLPYIEDFQSWKQGFSFYQSIRVRFSETDLFGHLNNTVPFTYFEEARIEFFKSLGFMKSWMRPGTENFPVVADLQCDFLQQIYFDEQLKVYVKTNKVGNSSIDLHYLGINDKGNPVFTGRGTIVQISGKTGKSVAWSDRQKKELTERAKKEIS